MRLLLLSILAASACASAQAPLTISWTNSILRVHGDHIPGGAVETWYLEAYCRPGSTEADWNDTVIGHETELLSATPTEIRLRCRVKDGIVVDHTIRAVDDEVRFAISAHNPTTNWSRAYWAQPCVRVGRFTGLRDATNKYEYIRKCFVHQQGRWQFMPTEGWGVEARYTPGQVWTPIHVDAADANPRPHNAHRASAGLIGAVSGDDRWIFAVAFEPYQELFQGVIHCIHSDFRIGGLAPGETQGIRGRMYIVPNDLAKLEARYRRDFPEHFAPAWDEAEVYRKHQRHGWTVYLHPDLERGDPESCQAALAELDRQLTAIVRAVPAPAVEKLRRCPIWMERKHPRHPCACYHVSEDWLRRHGMNPAKAGGMEIANAHNFVHWCKGQPWMVLHELAHGYHDQVLGYGNAEVNRAWRRALDAGLYGEVATFVPGRKRAHYGATNDREYFAEATEAYFGRNDFFPFTREELRTYDPGAVRMVEKAWGVPALK